MSTIDLIAATMMVLGPLFVAIGVFVFIYKNKAQWDAEMTDLWEKHQKETAEKEDS